MFSTKADEPLVTIVTVTFNSSAYVRDAIESVLAQQYTNIEYIIGDDCSTDNTWDIIQEYHDSRIKAYRNERNMGEYPNRNKAIDLATGKYLMFIDGDDFIYPHGIGYYVTMIEQFPDVAFAVQKGYYNNIIFPLLLLPEQAIRTYFFSKQNLLTSSFASDFFRTEVLKRSKLSERFKTGDEEIRLRLACQYPVLFIQGWVTWPRETPGQASSRLKDGEGFSEMRALTVLMFESGLITDEYLKKKITLLQKKQILGLVVRRLLRMRIGKALALINANNIKMSDFRYVFQKLESEDIFSKYSPGEPLKPAMQS